MTPSAFTRLCYVRDLLAEVREPSPSIRDLARQAHMSPYHFIRKFEAVFGVTPHQFRIRSRLDLAKLLLVEGNHSVTEVCLEAGFSSLGSFSDWFTRRVGTPPSVYGRRARSMVVVPGLPPPALFPGCLSLMCRLPAGAFRNFREAPPDACR